MAKLTARQRSAIAKKAAERRKAVRAQKARIEKARARSEASRKGWQTRKAKNPRAGRLAALKGWQTRKGGGERRLLSEAEKLRRQLEQRDAQIAELQRRLYVLENAPDIQSEHAELLATFKGSKGYGLTLTIQQIYLEHQDIYDEIHDLYEVYQEVN